MLCFNFRRMRATDFVALFETKGLSNPKPQCKMHLKQGLLWQLLRCPSVTCKEFSRMRDTDFASLLKMNGFINPKNPMQNVLIRRFPMANASEF